MFYLNDVMGIFLCLITILIAGVVMYLLSKSKFLTLALSGSFLLVYLSLMFICRDDFDMVVNEVQGVFTVVDKSEVTSEIVTELGESKKQDYQYVTLEDESGKRYVVKADIYQSCKCTNGDFVEARFTAIENKNETRNINAIIELKEPKETEE